MHVFTLALVDADPDWALEEAGALVGEAAERHGAECWNPVGQYYARMDGLWGGESPVFMARDLPMPLPVEALPYAYVDASGRWHSRPWDDTPPERFERWRAGLHREIDRLCPGGCVVRYDVHF